jgi:predicted acyl esterase
MSKNWEEQVSKPRYRVKTEKNARIIMKDNIRLAADIYRPDAQGKFPALLSMSAYGKDVQKLPSPIGPLNPIRGNGGQEAGDTEFFVTRGYVHVIVDVRGSGDSEGEFENFGLKEQEDGYDLVEWIASQSWCDGNVGMLGMSYFGLIQLLVAAQNPPHLKAIFPYEALTDHYRHMYYHGGIYNLGFQFQWWAHVSVGVSRPRSLREHPEEIKRTIKDLMQKEEIQTYVPLYLALKYPEKNVPMFEALTHPLDGPFYWEASPYTKFSQIKIPCYMVSRWSGWPVHLSGAFSAYNAIDAPKRLMIMETEYPSGPLRPWHDHHDIILRWYDYWLRGIDTGIMDEPPIKLFIKGKNVWRYEREWPLARTQWKKFYLRGNNGLSEEPPEKDESSDTFLSKEWPLPYNVIPGIRYRNSPFEKDMEVTGPMALYLYAALDQPDATWFVSINDVAPDGSSRLISKGWLRASHRAIDEKISKPYQPFHPHTESIPVEPREIYEYAIDIRETSNVFQAGHQIELVIKGQDSPSEDPIWYHLCNNKQTKHTIYHNAEYMSYLLLPLIAS